MHCTAKASGIGSVTAAFEYYWDFAQQKNIVAKIINVSSDLISGYEGDASFVASTVIVRIKTYYGSHVETAYCKV